MNPDKSKITAYVLWFLIGAFGAHRFYLRRVKSGILLAVLLVGSLALSGFGSYFLIQALDDAGQIEGLGQWNTPWFLLTAVGSILMTVWLIWYLLDLYFIHVMMKKDRETMPISEKQATSVFK